MQRRFRIIAMLSLLLPLTACITPPPPSAAEIAAKRFEPVPGKAVVYLFRDAVNYPSVAAPIELDGNPVGATFAGTFFRFVVEPGTHRIAGTVADSGAIQFTVAANQVYFIRQNAFVTGRSSTNLTGTAYTLTDPAVGRDLVSRYELLGG